MRATSRLAWRLLALAAFGATAALAVAGSSRAPVHARLIVAGRPSTSVDGPRVPRCAESSLRVWVGQRVHGGIDLEFTNVSRATCELSGYPNVAAYDVRHPGNAAGQPGNAAGQLGNAAGQFGNAAGRLASATPAVVLRPGATAHAAVELSVTGCRPAIAGGLRVGLPGHPAARSISYSVRVCAAGGTREPVFLRVGAIQPGAGDLQ
jgi:hypothetical protein